MADIKRVSPLGKTIMYGMMGIFTFLALFPILWLVIQSFKTTQDYMTSSKLALPHTWFLGNYSNAWTMGTFGVLILNSVFYTVITVTCVIVFGCMAGFGFAKIKNVFTPFLHGSFVIGILLTLQAILVPLFLMINMVGLFNTRLGVLIPYIGIGLPLGVFLSTEYIRNIPDAVIESARIDGAVTLRIFISIILPMTAPVAITIGILSFTATWNEFVLMNILTSSNAIKSIPVGVNRFSGALATDYGKQFAALVIAMVPTLIFYLSFRNQIAKGVTAGAVKG